MFKKDKKENFGQNKDNLINYVTKIMVTVHNLLSKPQK